MLGLSEPQEEEEDEDWDEFGESGKAAPGLAGLALGFWCSQLVQTPAGQQAYGQQAHESCVRRA